MPPRDERQELLFRQMRGRRFWRKIAQALGAGAILRPSKPNAEQQSGRSQSINGKADTIEELLSRDGHEFIRSAYLTLLGRKPDVEGHAFYMEQLQRLGDKSAIIRQIGNSREAKQLLIENKEFKAFIRRQNWKRIPLLRSVIDHLDFDGIASPPSQLHPTSAAGNVGNESANGDRRLLGGVAHIGPSSIRGESKWSCIMQPASEALQSDGYLFTRLMEFIWKSRKDLQGAYDIHQASDRLSFLKWLAMYGIHELGLTANVFPRTLLQRLVTAGGELGAIADQALYEQDTAENDRRTREDLQTPDVREFGANLVGYAFGEFGRGEDVRMVARSLNSLSVPFGIIDQKVGLHGIGDVSVANWVVSGARFGTNIFLINADLLPFLPFKLADEFSIGKYNIGYWAWELSQWPADFELALDMVDEVWAISEFVAESVKTRARVPVITMPNAVTVPQLGTDYTKPHYGLPPHSFVFYCIFDAASHLDRKNPVAVVRAFNGAFPNPATSVHLLLKTMNVEAGAPLWEALLAEVAGNVRISILTNRMSREEVLGLNVACDAFISLHRSEGFGRCVAEAMAYGKPVIATNYSGTRDFAREGTACVVDYHLVPVSAGAYPFSDNQVWAEPDIGHASALMQRLVYDELHRREIALAGQKFVLENFSEKSIGALYAKRLEEIRASRVAAPRLEGSGRDSEKVLLGNIDSPTADQFLKVSDTVPIEGWMASPEEIDTSRTE